MTAAAIWKALKMAFLDEQNEVRVYTLSQKVSRLRQNGRPVSTYFGELSEIFQELDHYSEVAMHCDKDIKVY